MCVDARQAGHRCRVELAVGIDHAQPPGALGDQQAAVGQEGEAPGLGEALRDRDHAWRGPARLAGFAGVNGEGGGERETRGESSQHESTPGRRRTGGGAHHAVGRRAERFGTNPCKRAAA